MWTVGVWLVTVVVIYITQYWIRKWRNPKCNGVLPPGSMGFPLIGETLSIIIPSYSLKLHPFIEKRVQRYGPIFRTSIAGRSVVIPTDQKFNNFLFNQEGTLVEQWYLDTFSMLFALEGENRVNGLGDVHKYIRGIFLKYFGAERIKERLLPQLEQLINKYLSSWSTQSSVEVKHVASVMFLDFSAKQIMIYDAEGSYECLSDIYARILEGFISFPLNIPGTAYHQCLKDQNNIVTMLKDIVKERQTLPNKTSREDLLDKMIKDMETEKFLSEDFIVNMIFGILFGIFESVSAIIALALEQLSEHPSVLEEMIDEQEAILKNRDDPNSPLTWDEYKSMTFTLHVINETLGLGNVLPGLLRRAINDIHVNGFTIPKGWTIIMVYSAMQLNPNTFQNPLEFNPWRWKELESHVVSKNFMPFGGGNRQCSGAEYTECSSQPFFVSCSPNIGGQKSKGQRFLEVLL